MGIITPGARVAAVGRNRVLFRDGAVIAALEGGELRRLAESDLDSESLRAMLSRRAAVQGLKPWLRAPTVRELERLRKRRETSVNETNPSETG
ncbi:hypothetical protein D3C83_10530 [compost metagenome]